MYEWAANPAKLERAIKELRDAKKEVTDEAVKAIYIRLAGKVLEEAPAVEEKEEKKEKKHK